MVTSRITKALRRGAMVSWRDQPSQHDIEALRANIRRVGLVVKVRWSLVIALATFSVLGAWAYAVKTPIADLVRNMMIPAAALAVVCVYNTFFHLTYKRMGNLRFFNHAQLILDTAVVTLLVYYSGGVYSWFASMYLLFILEAAFILPSRWETWLVAAVTAAGYGAVLGSEFLDLVRHVPMPFVTNSLQHEPTFVLVRYMWEVTVMAGTAAVSTLMMGAVRRREIELAKCAAIDGLTGLYNRGYCQRTLEDEIDRAAADGRSLAIVLADLDGFAAFNRLLGVDVGDKMLAAAAREMQRAVFEVAPSTRPSICRFGGEEFLVVLPGGDGSAAGTLAARVAERIRSGVERLNIDGASVTMSLGWASFPEHGASAGDLLVAADQALSASQAGGGNAVGAPQTEPDEA